MSNSVRAQQWLGFIAVAFSLFGVFSAFHWIYDRMAVTFSEMLQHGITPLQSLSWIWSGATSRDFAPVVPAWVGVILTIGLIAATIGLFVATNRLAKSTIAPIALSGAFLNVALYPEDGFGAAPDVPDFSRDLPRWPYDSTFDQQDRSNTNFLPYAAQDNQNYVSLLVRNCSQEPRGIAIDIEVDAILYFGASDGSAPNHPFMMRRTAKMQVIDPGQSSHLRLFDVTNLTGYLVQIEAVRYADITGRSRCSAYGLANLNKTPASNPIPSVRVFNRRPGEYTDAIKP